MRRILGAIALLLLALLFALQFPAVQTSIARFVANKLEAKMDGHIEIGSIRIHPFNAITIKDIVVLDKHPRPDTCGRGSGSIDTLASIGSLSATLSPRTLFSKKGIHINRVDADRVNFNMVIEPGGESGGTNLTRIFNIHGGNGGTMTLDSLFSIGRVTFTNSRYRMINLGPNPHNPKHGINYEDMDLRFDLSGHDVSFHGGRCYAVVDELKAKEKCGYGILSAGGTCAVGQGHVNIKNFRLKDNADSNCRFPKVNFNYENNPTAWSHFLDDVELDVTVAKGSHLVFHTIGNFSGSTFYGSQLAADITSLHFKGPISNFKVSDLVFTGTDCGVSGTVNCNLSGIPRPGNMRLDAVLTDIKFTTEGLTRLLADVGATADLSNLAPKTTFTVDGTASGYLNDLNTYLRVTSSAGDLNLRASAQNLVNSSPIEFAAQATGNDLNIGKIISSDALGNSNFTAVAHGTLGKKISLSIDNLTVPSIEILGYEYNDLEMQGTMEGSNAIAILRSSDPNAIIDLAANLDFKNKMGHIDAELTEVNLAAINLDKRGGKSLISCTIHAEQDITSDEPAHLSVTNLVVTGDEGTHELGDLEARARMKDNLLTLDLNSDMVDAKYNGTSDFGALVQLLRSTTVDRYIPSFFNPEGKEGAKPLEQDSSLSAVLHDTDGLLSFLLPGLTIGNGTTLNIDAGADGSVLGYITAPSIQWNGMSATGLDIAAGNLSGALDCTVDAERLDPGGFPINKASISASALDDLLSLSVNYDKADVLEGGGELFMDAVFSRNETDSLRIDVNTYPSQISIKGDTWELSQSAISMESGRIFTDGLSLFCDDQSILLEGGIRPNATDTLQVRFNELDVALVNAFTGNALGLEGILDGDATLVSPVSGGIGLTSALNLDGLGLSGTQAGDISLTSNWDDQNKAMAFHLTNSNGGVDGLDLQGAYGMADRSLVGSAVFDDFDLGIIQPFVKNFMPEIGGTVRGTLQIDGNTSDLHLSSDELMLNRARFRVGFTNVAYTLDGTLGITDNTVKFNNIGVRDDFGGMGVITGNLALGQFKSPVLNANLDMNRLKALNVPMGESGIGIYGDLAVSGSGNIQGPFNNLIVYADIATAGPGSINVPLSSSLAASGSDLLTFTEPEPDEEVKVEPQTPRAPAGKFTVHAKANVRPDVIANIEIDKDSGHVLTAGGSGDVAFDYYSAKKDIQLKGDYLIDKGKYLLNIPGILSKEFDIKEGSSLKFNGNLMASTMDINAVHNVKTSLGTLLADSTAVSTRRNVECGLNISGKLSSPEVSFSIDVPDLDPSTKMQVDAALSTTDKVQKQFVALLLFGTFLPEDNAGVVNGTNMIYSNVGEIVAGQLNNILQKLDIPVDFGFGYQQDNVGTDLFDVAVSTQLFNNRLVVGGSVGNRKYSTSKSANGDIVGDLDMELKLDRSGELRFKLFSHSADEYTSSLDFSQRNGMGLSYQKEYNHTGDFLKQLFTSRARRQQEAANLPKQKEMKIIEIEE